MSRNATEIELNPALLNILARDLENDRVKCQHCSVYVFGEGRAVSTHTIVKNSHTGQIRRICRRCWGQAVNRAFYTAASSPWKVVETVEVKPDWK